MSELDLNIHNYDLRDLLNLFKLPVNFDGDDLKSAKLMMLKTHPDKSNLDKKYFLFFQKAYNKVKQVYEFRSKRKKDMRNVTYDKNTNDITNAGNKELLKKFNGQKSSVFNKKFNELFEKHGKKSLDNGYGDWFRSDEDMDLTCEQRKENSRTLAISKEVDSLAFSSSISYGNLDNEANYGSSDLKSVYANDSVIGVTEKDLENKHRAKTLEELRKERSEKIDPLNELICEKYIEQNKSSDNTESSKRIFNLLVEEIEILKKNKNFWANLKQIEN